MADQDNLCGWVGDRWITNHAGRRFRERWNVLYESSLLREDVLDKIAPLLPFARQSDKNPAYRIYGPWIFVVSKGKGEENESVVTIMVSHQKLPHPVLQEDEIKHTFYLRMVENADGTLALARSAFKDFEDAEELLLRNALEAKALVHFLRILGMQVNYHAGRKENGSRTFAARIFLPHTLHDYSVWDVDKKVVLLAVADSLFKLTGVFSSENLEAVRAFVSDEQWLGRLEEMREEQLRREEEERRARQEQEEEKRRAAEALREKKKAIRKPRRGYKAASKWTRQQQWENLRGTALPY